MNEERPPEVQALEGGLKMVDYPLPMAVQTHEIVHLPALNRLFITQQSSNNLLTVNLNEDGRPLGVQTVEVPWTVGQGPHGLFVSQSFPGKLWCTLQFANQVLLLELDGAGQVATVSHTVKLPEKVKGPHCLVEDGGELWITCRESSHLVHVILNDEPEGGEFSFFSTSPQPIFAAVTETHVYSSLDVSSRIFCLDKRTGLTREVSVEDEGRTPAGLVTGPDGHAWFVLLEGASGTFGRMVGTEIQWLRLLSPAGGLIHLAFDRELSYSSGSCSKMKMWLLGSSMASDDSPDEVHVIHVDMRGGQARFLLEHTVGLASRRCSAYRLLRHRGGLFLTQLNTSVFSHITGPPVQGFSVSALWDDFSLYGSETEMDNRLPVLPMRPLPAGPPRLLVGPPAARRSGLSSAGGTSESARHDPASPPPAASPPASPPLPLPTA